MPARPLLRRFLIVPRPSAPSPTSDELPILEATLELIRWFIPILHRLPCHHRLSSAQLHQHRQPPSQ